METQIVRSDVDANNRSWTIEDRGISYYDKSKRFVVSEHIPKYSIHSIPCEHVLIGSHCEIGNVRCFRILSEAESYLELILSIEAGQI